jgi:hypothetical protein
MAPPGRHGAWTWEEVLKKANPKKISMTDH